MWKEVSTIDNDIANNCWNEFSQQGVQDVSVKSKVDEQSVKSMYISCTHVDIKQSIVKDNITVRRPYSFMN